MALAAVGRRVGKQLGIAPIACAAQRWIHTAGAAEQQSQQPKAVAMSKLKDSFLDGTSSTYLEELEERYRSDPQSVDKTWGSFFKSLESGVNPEAVAEAFHAFEQGSDVQPLSAAAVSNQTIQESMRLLLMVRAYQVNGHFIAKLDPLGIEQRPVPPELDPALYGFSEKDMDREFFLGTWKMRGVLAEDRPIRTLREVLDRLRDAYCGTTGYEFMHIADRDKCNWLRERIELVEQPQATKDEKLHMFDRLSWSSLFETFMANKYAAAKRFGLEGCETLIPAMKTLIDRSAELGTEAVCMGMPHRGRLNVLANVVRKPMKQIFSEFSGVQPKSEGDTFTGTGDVKYHLGTSYDRPTATGKRVHLSLLANPSHLEAVDPVVLGKVRAKQYYSQDTERLKNLCILMHGDGSFAGQGVVYETLDMSQLPEYTVGGTIHVIVNNQVAFTTDPKKSRSSPYCTDVAKALSAPIFHVNADDVEAVVRASKLAADWRATWKTDVVLDLVCYRRYGHNEIDEPMFTQPIMYNAIRSHPTPLQIYEKRLLEEGVVSKEEMSSITDNVQSTLSSEFDGAKSYKPDAKDWLSSYWKGFMGPDQLARIRNTGVPKEFLRDVGTSISTIPDGFNPHRMIKKVFEQRRGMVEEREDVDWGMAELLAFGTLLAEGNHVRISGQDVERGTFSSRHAVIHDQKTGERYIPLQHISSNQKPGSFAASNSSLSEFGIMGFELGYALENPNSLVCWEAQFGDFANGAQTIFDQFLTSGEAKWLRQNGLVCLLPHGYDGQGPEHSSARLERFLQMSDEDPYMVPAVDESKWFTGGHLGSQTQSINIQIANCTTPANYFHLLRRQIHRQFRKPLLVFSPKNLLRHPAAKSHLREFDDIPDDKGIQGVRFKRLIMDTSATDRSPHPPEEPDFKRVVFCSGKVYYELAAEREKQGKQKEVAIVRMEQLAPFPYDLVMREIRRYPNAEIMWSQEEPMNMGAYTYVVPRMNTCLETENRLRTRKLPYAGRKASASPATGFGNVHAAEQASVLKTAMDI